MFFSSGPVDQKGYSSLLSFTVTDINSSVTKLMTLGAELDGPIKHEIHGKVLSNSLFLFMLFHQIIFDSFLNHLLVNIHWHNYQPCPYVRLV